jgi:hypothetical protein
MNRVWEADFPRKGELQVELSGPVPGADWGRVYASDSLALPSQSRIWAKVIARSSGARDLSRHYRFSDGVEAVLPLFAMPFSPRFLRVFRSPPPAWGFGGPVSTSPLSVRHLRAVLSDCAKLPCAAVQIRPNPLDAAKWAEAARGTGWQMLPRRAHVLDLTGGFEEVWGKRFPQSTRNKVRKAIKAGVMVEAGTSAKLIADFDTLFRRSLTRWAQRQNEPVWLADLRGRVRDPKGKFVAMARDAGRILRIYVGYLEGAPVAGIVVLIDQNGHMTRGAFDRDRIGKSNANYLLHKIAIEDICGQHGRYYHMGETGNSTSLADFKSRFGAEAVAYAEYRFERIPLLSADQKLRSVVKRAIGFIDV